MKKVFLGGTCNNSPWRKDLIPLLEIDYFDPVVEKWTEEHYLEEIRQREICDFCLYVLTPRMTGVYSIAEVVDDSNKRPEKTILCILDRDINPFTNYFNNFIYFNSAKERSLEKVAIMVEKNGGKIFRNLQDVADYLNQFKDE